MTRLDTTTRHLTPPKLAEQLGVDPSKVLAWIASGELVALNLATSTSGRPRWAITPNDLERFLTGRRSCRPINPQRRRRSPSKVGEFL